MGIPKNSIVQYEGALKSDKYIVIAHGSASEVAHAREIISTTHPESIEDHQLPATEQQVVLVAA
jgi:hypothetical protein